MHGNIGMPWEHEQFVIRGLGMHANEQCHSLVLTRLPCCASSSEGFRDALPE